MARAVRLFRALLGCGGLWACSLSQLGSSVTLEMRSARVKPGLVCPVPASWERLYSRLEEAWDPVSAPESPGASLWRGLERLKSGWERPRPE